MHDPWAIKTSNVNKYFGNFQALKDVSISVPQGEIFGFIGKNGAGKTTLMRIICGLMKPGSGKVDVSKSLGFLPQNVRFLDNMDGNSELHYFSSLRSADAGKSIQFAKELEVDLHKKVRNLSPGQQRKLQLVIATIGFPEIIVLDEPTAGLDPSGVQQVREIIGILHGKGCTVFISSHVLMELDNLCSKVAVIDKGRLLYQGSCSTVYEIETGGVNQRVFDLLPGGHKNRCTVEGNTLLAGIEKQEVSGFLNQLHEVGVEVFSVKRQGLEMLYNKIVKEGA